MAAIIANEIRIGNILDHLGGMWRVCSKEHVKPGKGGAFVQVELKNIITNAKLNERFRSEDTVTKITFEATKATFLYKDGDNLEVMDDESFEQITIPSAILGESLVFLQENMQIMIEKAGDTIVGLKLPDTIVATINYTQPYVKGATQTASFKPATLDNGVEVRVPEFIESGEKIVVKTEDATYVERYKGGK